MNYGAAKKGAQPQAASRRQYVCVFAIKNPKLQKLIEIEFRDVPIRIAFVSTIEDLQHYQTSQDTFLNFVDIQAFPDAAKVLGARNKNSKAFWVAIGDQLSVQFNQMLLKIGISDILPNPVHPVTFKSRARALLVRYTQMLKKEKIVLEHNRNKNLRNTHLALTSIDKGPAKPTLSPKATVARPQIKPSKAPQNVSPMQTGVFGKHRVFSERLKVIDKARKVLRPQKDLFQSVSTATQKAAFIKELNQLSPRAQVWGPKQKWQRSCRVVAGQSQDGRVHFSYPRGVYRQEFQDLLMSSPVGRIFVSFCLNRVRLFFGQNPKEFRFDLNEFSVKFPDDIFQVQRREFFRFNLTETLSVGIKITNKFFDGLEFNALNISAGGALITASDKDAAKFSVKDACRKIEFVVYGKVIECAAIVQWKSPADDEGMCNIGLRFVNMDPMDRDGLNLFVMEEAYQYLQSYVAID